MTFYQIALPIVTLVYFLQVFVVRSYIHYKQMGINPFVFSKGEGAHDYVGKVYKFMTLGIWISISFYSFFPSLYKYLLPVWYLDYAWLQHVGASIVLVSFTWIIVAQFQMSKSWRIGIDYSEKTELIKSGLFKYSRNPIFLGVIISYIGTFLIIPNALTFGIMVLTYVSIQLQVRMEEEYLQKMHGDRYEQYKNEVNRWV